MKVLIVDDEPLVRRSLRRAFEAKGHEVLDAVDGRSALKVWLDFLPDVVLLDVLMPGLSGPEVLRQLGPDRSPAKVILMSAYSGDYNLETAQKMGADLFHPKPFEDVFEVVKLAEGLRQ
jgi:CheY-like chemotaxis protein